MCCMTPSLQRRTWKRWESPRSRAVCTNVGSRERFSYPVAGNNQLRTMLRLDFYYWNLILVFPLILFLFFHFSESLPLLISRLRTQFNLLEPAKEEGSHDQKINQTWDQ